MEVSQFSLPSRLHVASQFPGLSNMLGALARAPFSFPRERQSRLSQASSEGNSKEPCWLNPRYMYSHVLIKQQVRGHESWAPLPPQSLEREPIHGPGLKSQRLTEATSVQGQSCVTRDTDQHAATQTEPALHPNQRGPALGQMGTPERSWNRVSIQICTKCCVTLRRPEVLSGPLGDTPSMHSTQVFLGSSFFPSSLTHPISQNRKAEPVGSSGHQTPHPSDHCA